MTHAPIDPDDPCDALEAGRLWGVSGKTMLKLRRQGALPIGAAWRLGRSRTVRFSRKVLLAHREIAS